MKQKLLSLFLALFTMSAIAQTQTIRIQEKVNKLDVSTFVAKDGMTYTNLSLDGAVSVGEVGTPALPVVRHLIALPMEAEPTIKVKNYTTQEFTLNELGVSAPVAPFQLAQNNADVAFTVNRKAYATDAFVQNNIATVSVLGTLRGVKIAQVAINPVDYNPALGIVRQYSNIHVEVEYDAPTSEITVPAHLQSPYFDVIYKVLSNGNNVVTRTAGDDYPDHPDLTKYPVRMLIITDRMFEETLKPYVEWKTQKGFDVEVAYTDNIGSSAYSIRSHIKSRYNSSASEGKAAPSFVMIVGDVNQVPASNTYSMVSNTPNDPFSSDYMYGQMDDEGVSEYFPEIYYGRLSAETTKDLKTIIDKILYYEKYLFEDPTFLNRATLIAGSDPNNLDTDWGQPRIKYLAANYFNAENGYSTVHEYGVKNQDYTGCYSSENFQVGFVAYTVHSDQYCWGPPLFYIKNEFKDDLDKVKNPNQYPLVIANSCLSADFAFVDNKGKNICIGEAFLRKANGGAIAYIGSTPISNWQGDHVWTMGARTDTNGTPSPSNTTVGAYDAPFVSDYVSTGGILFCGNLAVTKASTMLAPQFWTGYNILGDPSLVPYFTEADPIEATYSKTIPVGATSYTVAAPHRSHVALSSNGNKLLASALVDNSGSVTLTFDAVQETDNVMLVITKPQHQPIIENLSFGPNAIEDITVSSTPTKIEVFNLQGVLVCTIEGENVELSTDQLAPGTYLVVSTSETDRKVEKVVVQ